MSGEGIDLSALAVERWREKQLEAVLRADLATLRASYESPWCAAQHVDSLPPALTVQSPLVWAVLGGHAQLVRFLMRERSERIPFPHRLAECGCSLCQALRRDPRLRRLYAERLLPALASPLYQAFRASGEDVLQQGLNFLRRLAKLQSDLPADLLRPVLRRGSGTLAMLLDGCWTSDEAFALLLDGAAPRDRLGKLGQFADLGLREPLAHQAAQLVLDRAWTHGCRWPEERLAGLGAGLPSCALALSAVAGYALAPVYLLCPHPRLRPLCQSARFGHALDTVAFAASLALLAAWVSSSRDLNDGLARAAVCGASGSPVIGGGQLALQALFIMFACAYAVKNAQHIFLLGYRRLARVTGFFGMLHHLALGFYLVGLPLTLVWAARLRSASEALLAGAANASDIRACVCSALNVSALLCSQPTSLACSGLGNFTGAYSSLLLDSLEPQLAASLAMGCGHALSLLSVFSVAALQRHVGTLVVSLSRVLKDVVNFGAVLLVALFAWTCLLISLYRVVSCSSAYFQTDASVFQTLVWSLFTMSDRDDHLLLSGSAQHPTLRTLELLGLLAHVTFITVGAVILINLLVAMMSETFGQLSSVRESDWVYRASLTKIKYLRVGPDLPVPFNLLWPLHLLCLMLWDRISAAMQDGPAEPPLTYLTKRTRLDYGTALSSARQRLRMRLLAGDEGDRSRPAAVADRGGDRLSDRPATG